MWIGGAAGRAGTRCLAVVAALTMTAGCGASAAGGPAGTPATSQPPAATAGGTPGTGSVPGPGTEPSTTALPSTTSSVPTTTSGGPATTGGSATTRPAPIDPRLAGLPPGNGARIAIVVDDVGGPDTYLADYLALAQPVTFAVIPFAPAAPADDQRIHAAGRELLLHLPLANHTNHGDGRTRLTGTERPEQVEAFVQAALARVPHAVGANNHEGSYGSTQPALMRALLTSLRAHGLFFMDSVTSQRTVGFALEAPTGHPPRINNVFLDHMESDDDSLAALAHLARVAAVNGSAIGICHVHHPYLARMLAAHGAELEAMGYRFLPLSQVTDALADGLDQGVRPTL